MIKYIKKFSKLNKVFWFVCIFDWLMNWLIDIQLLIPIYACSHSLWNNSLLSCVSKSTHDLGVCLKLAGLSVCRITGLILKFWIIPVVINKSVLNGWKQLAERWSSELNLACGLRVLGWETSRANASGRGVGFVRSLTRLRADLPRQVWVTRRSWPLSGSRAAVFCPSEVAVVWD